MPRSSSLDRPVFKSNNFAQFQELNSARRLLTGSFVFTCIELGIITRGIANLPQFLLQGEFRSQKLCALPCSPIRWEGTTWLIHWLPEKAVSSTIFHAPCFHFSPGQWFCINAEHMSQGDSDKTLSRAEMEFTELSFQQCCQGRCHPTERTWKTSLPLPYSRCSRLYKQVYQCEA